MLSVSWNGGKVAWYENADGLGGFGPQQVISGTSFGGVDVRAPDLDDDGDFDVLATWYNTSLPQGTVAWFENGAGAEGAWPDHVISQTVADWPRSSYAEDLDGDGDRDVLTAFINTDTVQWHANDGGGSFGPGQVITSQIDGPQDVVAADLDGDLDQDVVVAGTGSGQVLWYRNGCSMGLAASEVIRLGVPPNPAVFLPGVSTGPVVGALWNPVIDHTTFVPGAVSDIAGLTLSPANLSLPPFGTLLCDVFAGTAYQFTTVPGVPFEIPIPLNCNLIGVSLCSQGISIDGQGDLRLTNALDITLGAF